LKVILAKTAGFCKGVRRALNMVLEKSEQEPGPLYTDGPLIHNPQTIEILERRGIKVAGKGKSPGPGDTLFIRTHGISPERRQELLSLRVRLCDATCPDVAKIQGLIRLYKRSGHTIIIVGDKNHAEVIGLAGNAGDMGHVVTEAREVKDLPPAERVCIVAQSTFDPDIYSRVAQAVKERYSEVVVLDTICPSTYRRQEEIRKLAQSADAVVVVGGKNSANTCRLVQISENIGTPTFHVETAGEIKESDMQRFHSVAVTAGASTPNWILMEVVDRLKEIEYQASSSILRALRKAVRFIIKGNLLVAFGSVMLLYANARLMGIILDWLPYLVAFCYILSVHLLSHFTDQGAFELTLDHRLSAYRTQGKLYITLSAISAIMALILAGLKGLVSFSLMLLLIVLGALYRIDIFKFISLPINAKNYSLRLIPASKDLFMALGWSFVTVFFPLFLTGIPFLTPAFFLTFATTFLLVTVRSLFFDIRDIQGDKIVGRETLPTIIGTRGTKILIMSLTSFQALLLILGSGERWLTGFGYFMLLVTAYIFFYLFLYHRRVIYQGTDVEIMGDMQFILAGILALIYP